MQPIPNVQLEALAQRFVRFADQECGAYAPLYDRLARGIAGDPELLTIAAHTRSGQQAPLLLLAAVHYLLLGGADHALGAFYPSVTPHAAVPQATRCQPSVPSAGTTVTPCSSWCPRGWCRPMSRGAAPCCCRPSPRWRAWQGPAARADRGRGQRRPEPAVRPLWLRLRSGSVRRGSQCARAVRLRAARGDAATAPRGAAAGDHPRRH